MHGFSPDMQESLSATKTEVPGCLPRTPHRWCYLRLSESVVRKLKEHRHTSVKHMAANILPWYRRILGPELCVCQTIQNANVDCELPRIPIEIFLKDCMQNDFTVGLYFASLESLADERTNQLIQLYHTINSNKDDSNFNSCADDEPNQPKRFPIIHVTLGLQTTSSHRNGRKPIDSRTFCAKLQHLPWYTIPFADHVTLERLTRRFEIRTLSPVLMLIDGKTGKLLTKHGIEKMASDPMGLDFPWTPLPVSQILENIDLVPGGQSDVMEPVKFSSLAGLVIGFYFSAHWCPPCRCFTPQLKQTYMILRNKNVGFKIIFVSSDRSRESFDAYTSEMPWLAVPYHYETMRLELAALFGVQGIPTLVITDSDGNIITTDGRAQINQDPTGIKFPWRPKAVNILTDRLFSRLQDHAAVILFIDGEAPEMEFAESVLLPVASAYKESNEASITPLDFFIAIDMETSDTLRDLIGLDDAVPVLTIINLPEGTWSILEEGVVINKETVQDMVTKFLNNTLPTVFIGHH